MTKNELIAEIERQGLEDVLEMIEDAEAGELTEIEMVESIGLLYDRTLNEALLNLLKEFGVTIIYVSDEED